MINSKLKRLPVSEATIQKHCLQWFRAQHHNIPISSFPNDAIRIKGPSDHQGFALLNHLKAMGFESGMPDLIIFRPMIKEGRVVGALLIEMKKPGEKPNEKQKRIHLELKKAGYHVEVATSLDEFVSVVTNYLAD